MKDIDLLDASSSNSMEGGASFSFRNRLTRVTWQLCWLFLARWTPVRFFWWRRLLLVLFGARIDNTARIYPSTKVWLPSNLTMNRHSCLGPNVDCYAMGPIHIGAYAIVSQNAVLCAGTHNIDIPSFQLVAKPIMIGDGSWIASEAFVGPGVVLADGSVIGARCVVFRNTEKNGVYIGNPAKLIRHRRLSNG
jgi:putative colanic acid biosynthesis acetyltransferase WcaF